MSERAQDRLEGLAYELAHGLEDAEVDASQWQMLRARLADIERIAVSGESLEALRFVREIHSMLVSGVKSAGTGKD